MSKLSGSAHRMANCALSIVVIIVIVYIGTGMSIISQLSDTLMGYYFLFLLHRNFQCTNRISNQILQNSFKK